MVQLGLDTWLEVARRLDPAALASLSATSLSMQRPISSHHTLWPSLAHRLWPGAQLALEYLPASSGNPHPLLSYFKSPSDWRRLCAQQHRVHRPLPQHRSSPTARAPYTSRTIPISQGWGELLFVVSCWTATSSWRRAAVCRGAGVEQLMMQFPEPRVKLPRDELGSIQFVRGSSASLLLSHAACSRLIADRAAMTARPVLPFTPLAPLPCWWLTWHCGG